MTVFDLGACLLRSLPAESAHRITLKLVGLAKPILVRTKSDDPRLGVRALGLDFQNPIGLAAGFDKDADVPDSMIGFGFGFVECGTVTPRPQTGNPRPRLFRLTEDQAIINRLGFNNQGMHHAARNLKRRKGHGIIGINIGANKDSQDRVADYVAGFQTLAPLADYVTVNVSSPNTPGLRGLQNRDELSHLLKRLTDTRTNMMLSLPIVLKIAPDLEELALDEIAEVVRQSGIEGLMVSNTTIARTSLKSVHARQSGGLSGKPLFLPSTRILAEMHKRLRGAVTLIGVGGIWSGQDAYRKIRAGASLVEIYSALVFQGPGLVERVKKELLQCLERDGFANVMAAVGTGAE